MVVLLGVLGGAAAFALAAGSAPPAPRILSHPVDRTRARPATFTFTDARPNVTFVCSLDGRRYTACTSPQRYGVLAHGHHVFRVRARSSSGALSDPATYSWKIDLAAPHVKVKFPARRGIYGATAWRTSCQRRRGGICGTVFAPSGVHTVILWIKQNSTQRWWNGHAFKARHAIWKRAILSPKPHHAQATDPRAVVLPAVAPQARRELHRARPRHRPDRQPDPAAHAEASQLDDRHVVAAERRRSPRRPPTQPPRRRQRSRSPTPPPAASPSSVTSTTAAGRPARARSPTAH